MSYIARESGLLLKSGKQLASYNSPIRRLAELPVGEEGSMTLQGEQQAFTLIEKTSFTPSLQTASGTPLETYHGSIASPFLILLSVSHGAGLHRAADVEKLQGSVGTIFLLHESWMPRVSNS